MPSRCPCSRLPVFLSALAPKGGSKQQSPKTPPPSLSAKFCQGCSSGPRPSCLPPPVWLNWSLWHMDLPQAALLCSVMASVSTDLVAFASENVQVVLKHKVAQKREAAVSEESARKLSEADDRKLRESWAEAADHGATAFSIFYTVCPWLWPLLLPSSHRRASAPQRAAFCR
ncbi:translocon-associated protein subunit gamma-like [Meriones unguiculatus]|uniref:translocon-associated protein subunit gamma-like n=1 Tax=Meriones unguiculatus TaxID=10047 RepID=UPI00293F70F4|nr:translocon-associated protein subunit gamma-like [Meriones unguiculatus]